MWNIKPSLQYTGKRVGGYKGSKHRPINKTNPKK